MENYVYTVPFLAGTALAFSLGTSGTSVIGDNYRIEI